MREQFFQISEAVHGTVRQEHCTRIVITKEWLGGPHGSRALTKAEWDALYETLLGQHFITTEAA